MYAKESLDQVVYDQFMTGFYSCTYHADEVLDPAELADRYGVSRTPVVQALKRLANEKIIGVRGNGRFYIPVPDAAMLQGICRTRILFEQEAVEQLIQNGNQEALDSLHEMARRCFSEAESVNEVESVKQDMSFHRMLVGSAGNVCLRELYDVVLNRFISVKYVLRDQYSYQKLGASRHIQLMTYVDQKDVEKARACVDSHITGSMERLMGIMESAEN